MTSAMLSGMNYHFKDPETRLHAYVRDNDIRQLQDAVALCVTEKLEIDFYDPAYGTALEVAVLCDNMPAAEILLRAGANPWDGAWADSTPLWAAISSGNTAMLHCFCEHMKGSDGRVSQRCCEFILEKAAFDGLSDIVQQVLGWCQVWPERVQRNAMSNAICHWEPQTALILVKEFESLRKELDYYLRCAVKFKFDFRVVHPKYDDADYLRQQQLVSCLIDAGANPNNALGGDHIILEAAEFVDLVGVLETLLERDADPDRRGRNGETALHRLGSPARCEQFSSRTALHGKGIHLLLQHGASVTLTDQEGNTPLHCAAFGSNMHIFTMYLENLPNFDDKCSILKDLRNEKGETLLHQAAWGKNLDVMRFLIQHGAGVNDVTKDGRTPLLFALKPSTIFLRSVKQNKKAGEAAKLLLMHGAHPLSGREEERVFTV